MSKSESIKKILMAFLAIAQTHLDKYEPKDLKLIQKNERWIERFADVTTSNEEAVKALDKALQWRKNFGVNQLTEKSFPPELHELGLFCSSFKDKEERPVLWIRLMHSTRPEIGYLIKQFTIYYFEKLDSRVNNEGWTVVVDMTGSGLQNIDMPWFLFVIEAWQSYYPRGVKNVWVVNMPILLDVPIRTVISTTNNDLKPRIQIVTTDQLKEHIDESNLPQHLNQGSSLIGLDSMPLLGGGLFG